MRSSKDYEHKLQLNKLMYRLSEQLIIHYKMI